MPVNKRRLAAETGRSTFGIVWTDMFRGSARRRIADRDGTQRHAFEALLEPCWDALWRYAYRTTGNAHDAGDLLAETVIDGFRSFQQFRGDTTFLKWMYRIMSTSHIDMLRRASRHRADSLDVLIEQGFTHASKFADEAADPEVIVVGTTLSEDLQRALHSLSDEYRAVVALVDMEQLDYSEVSEILQIPIGTVRSRLHRARAQLRDKLASHVEPRW